MISMFEKEEIGEKEEGVCILHFTYISGSLSPVEVMVMVVGGDVDRSTVVECSNLSLCEGLRAKCDCLGRKSRNQ